MPKETRETILQNIVKIDSELSSIKIREGELWGERRFWVSRLIATDDESKKKLDHALNEVKNRIIDLDTKVEMLVETNFKKASSHRDVIENLIYAIMTARRFASIGKWTRAADVGRKSYYNHKEDIKNKIQKMGKKFFIRKTKNSVEVWIED